MFGKDARLSTYLMKSRLSGEHVSRDLATDMLEYGYDAFRLIIVEHIGMDLDMLHHQEQLWMMLYPIYNRSLKVGFNEGQPMCETDRRAMSTSVFQYKVADKVILPGTEQEHHGIKELTRRGFRSVEDPVISISMPYYDINVLLKTGALYRDQFLFTREQLVGDVLASWKAPVIVSDELTIGRDK